MLLLRIANSVFTQIYHDDDLTLQRAEMSAGYILPSARLTYIFNFWHSGTLALSPERQSARMSEIKNVG